MYFGIIFSRFFAVITGRVPVILVQRGSYLFNKFALLLKRSMFRQDCRNGLCVTSGNDGKEREHSVCYQFFKQIPAKRVSLPQNLY